VLVLQGHATLAWRRIKLLRNLYPNDSAVHSSADEFETQYRSLG
jgi:hypothetical protein